MPVSAGHFETPLREVRAKRLGKRLSADSRFPVLVKICDQAFSIGTSCVLLAAGHREKRAVRDFHAELLREKVFRANLRRSERDRKRQENGRLASRRKRNLLTGKAAGRTERRIAVSTGVLTNAG